MTMIDATPIGTTFDGFRWGNWSGQHVGAIYLAALARRGDKLAAEILTATNVTILDMDGRQYWPVVAECGKDATV